ncbi:MAG: HDOD domain-containing protein [Leptospirales bacterium]|nr:HDOD domain-containing protein [Leptospirales bacterium]
MNITKTSELTEQILKGEPVKLTFHYNTKEINRFLNSLFIKILSHSDMLYLSGTIENVLREMIVNAVKANTKRIFFKKNNLDIIDPEHYEQGMSAFKNYMIETMDILPDELKENGYKVEFVLKKDTDGFKAIVRNNAGLLPSEQERINQRINKSKEYNDFSDLYSDIADDQEGEGLGIPLTMMFLKNSGIGDKSFSIISDGKITQSSFLIPFKTQPLAIKRALEVKIVNSVNDLPTFPEYITEIQRLCETKDASINVISEKISLDPSLAASVLKLANSAGFITSKKIESISEAVKIIGLKNLNSILLASSAKKIMDENLSNFQAIWDHCNRVAFYARELASKFGLNKISEMVFLASILHDLGKIVFLSINEDMTKQIETLSVNRHMRTSTALEEATLGISHSTIGKMIAEKWNFHDYIKETIAYHHSPLLASEKNIDIVFITYLANSLCMIEERKFDFYYLEEEVLKRYGLESEEKFNELHESIKTKFINNESQ